MKKIIIILITVLIAYSAVFWLFPRNTSTEILNKEDSSGEVENTIGEETLDNETTINNGKFCFSRNQIATEEAPYSVEEYIRLNINENMVSGVKEGTQEGPDMTNGYKGTLSGEIVNGVIGVIFSYVIEGSAQKEKEEYILRDGDLIKQRYSLVEEDGILVPDKDSEKSEIVYDSVSCE